MVKRCSKCQHSFRNLSTFINHLKSCGKIAKLNCEKCKFETLDSEVLKEHEQSAHPIKKDNDNLLVGVRKVSDRGDNRTVEANVNRSRLTPDETKNDILDLTGDDFTVLKPFDKSKGNKNEPALGSSSNTVKEDRGTVGEVSIETSVKSTASLSGNNPGQNTVKKVSCPLCLPKVVYLSKNEYKSHFQDVHKNCFLKCDRCLFFTANKSILADHYKKEHKQLLHLCPHCDAIFKIYYHLPLHILGRHKPSTPVDCSWCCYKTTDLKLLKAHFMNSHQTHLLKNHEIKNVLFAKEKIEYPNEPVGDSELILESIDLTEDNKTLHSSSQKSTPSKTIRTDDAPLNVSQGSITLPVANISQPPRSVKIAESSNANQIQTPVPPHSGNQVVVFSQPVLPSTSSSLLTSTSGGCLVTKSVPVRCRAPTLFNLLNSNKDSTVNSFQYDRAESSPLVVTRPDQKLLFVPSTKSKAPDMDAGVKLLRPKTTKSAPEKSKTTKKTVEKDAKTKVSKRKSSDAKKAKSRHTNRPGPSKSQASKQRVRKPSKKIKGSNRSVDNFDFNIIDFTTDYIDELIDHTFGSPTNTQNPTQYFCDSCPRVFISTASLEEHKKAYHPCIDIT